MSIEIVTKSAEVKVVEMLNTIRDPDGWHAVHFHLSNLLEQYKSDYQVKIAINLINDLLKDYEGGIFLLGDSSIVVLCKELEKALLSKLIFQLRYLYMDDPLAYTDEGQENPKFCSAYDLERNWQDFFEQCTRRMAISVRKPAAAVAMERRERLPVAPPVPVLEVPPAPMPPKPPVQEALPPEPVEASRPSVSVGLSANKLAGIESDLRVIDLNRVIRKQPVCIVQPNMVARRVFDESYIHIAHLRQLMRSDVDFLSNRWLFKYLTHILDERMLEMIGTSPVRYIDSPISINVNVESLLSSHFSAFDARIKPEMKVSIVFEVPVVDVFADIAAFKYAKQDLQKMGYRVCLDGLTTESFLNIDRGKLGLDLIKVQWNADVKGEAGSEETKAMLEAVKSCGNNRVILCRCDNLQAVQYGHTLGISLFQGRYIDSLINPTAKVSN